MKVILDYEKRSVFKRNEKCDFNEWTKTQSSIERETSVRV